MQRLVVVTGLPASGKTSITGAVQRMTPSVVIPELVEWIRGRRTLPGPPQSVAEKKRKQSLLLAIDVERTEAALAARAKSRHTVIMDTDYLSALAYNAADRRRAPHLDVFEWLRGIHLDALQDGRLVVPDIYIVLDVSQETREARRRGDVRRRRNDVFFDAAFASEMQRYLMGVLERLSELGVAAVLVVDAERSPSEVRQDVAEAISLDAPNAQWTPVERLEVAMQCLRSQE